MEKKYKCGMCGSESTGTPGTCCGGERKEVVSNVCVACETGKGEHHHGDEHKHDHKEGEKCPVCSA